LYKKDFLFFKEMGGEEMQKISNCEFEQIMSYNKRNNICIEINFCVDSNANYTSCWLGKLNSKENSEVVYWFGLMADGSEAYEFDSKKQFLEAKVFNGKSIKDIWELVTIISIDGCEVEERLPYYLA